MTHDELIEYNFKIALEEKREAAKALDHIVFFSSTGAFTLVATFFTGLKTKITSPEGLVLSLVLLLGALVAHAISYRIAIDATTYQMRKLDKGDIPTEETDPSIATYNSQIDTANNVSQFLALTGIILLLVFVVVNIL